MQAETLSVGGRRVHVWRGGEGPPLVLLHGAIGEAERCWSKIWDRLAESYDVVAPDIPGCGGTQSLARSSLPDLAAWLDGVIDALGLSAVRLVGTDAGASIARTFAADHPHRCHGLVLINGGALPRTPARFLTRLGLGARPEPTAHTLVLWTQDDHPGPHPGHRLAAELPRAALRLLPGQGPLLHPQVEAPAETIDILLTFLG